MKLSGQVVIVVNPLQLLGYSVTNHDQNDQNDHLVVIRWVKVKGYFPTKSRKKALHYPTKYGIILE